MTYLMFHLLFQHVSTCFNMSYLLPSWMRTGRLSLPALPDSVRSWWDSRAGRRNRTRSTRFHPPRRKGWWILVDLQRVSWPGQSLLIFGCLRFGVQKIWDFLGPATFRSLDVRTVDVGHCGPLQALFEATLQLEENNLSWGLQDMPRGLYIIGNCPIFRMM